MHTNTLKPDAVPFPRRWNDDLAPFSFLPPPPNWTVCPLAIDTPHSQLTNLFLLFLLLLKAIE